MRSLSKTLLFVSLLTTNTFGVKAQVQAIASLNFKNLDDLPYTFEWPAVVTNGSFIYAINGFTPKSPVSSQSYSRDVLIFNTHNNKWIAVNNNAGSKIQSSAAYMPSNHLIYVFGGVILGTPRIYQDVQTVDINTGEIKELGLHNRMPVTYGYASEWNNLIYLYGGTQQNGQTISTVYSFDPKTSEFNKLANMPETLQTAGAVIDGVIYTFGGFDGFINKQSANVNAYDIKTDTWKTVGKLPQSISSNSIAVCGNLVFIVGDYNNETFLGYYNIRSNKFTQVNSNMSGHRAGGAAIINNILYVFGGKTNQGYITGGNKSVQSADISDIIKRESANNENY